MHFFLSFTHTVNPQFNEKPKRHREINLSSGDKDVAKVVSTMKKHMDEGFIQAVRVLNRMNMDNEDIWTGTLYLGIVYQSFLDKHGLLYK